ncbi:MAG TPA: terminase large subunit [Pirellulaceae bacterium]|nr:terminase large subunit [Pirellulaceae bacterium]
MTPNLIRESAGNPMAFFAALLLRIGGELRPFGDCWADFQREWLEGVAPSLLSLARGEKPHQARFWIEATKGAAKSLALAMMVLWLLAFAAVPQTIQIAAADQDQAAEIIKWIRLLLHFNPWLGSRIEVTNWKIVCEATSSEAEILAADVAGSHGARPNLLIIDEIHAVTKWEFVENLLDNASKVDGVVLIATNAGMVDSQPHKLREMAVASPRWTVWILARPAPWLSDEELAEARARNRGERFNRLFGGIWSHGTGEALNSADVTACTIAAARPHLCRLSQAYIGAVDLARTRDHAAFAVLGIDAAVWSDPLREDEPPPRVSLARCNSWNPKSYADGRIPLDEIRRTILETDKELGGLDAVLFDTWQAVLMAEQLSAAGLRCVDWVFNTANLDVMARDLIEAFQSRWIRLFPCPELERDLYKLNLVERPQGFRLDAKRDASGHADRAFALAIALPTALAWSREMAIARDAPPLRECIMDANGNTFYYEGGSIHFVH